MARHPDPTRLDADGLRALPADARQAFQILRHRAMYGLVATTPPVLACEMGVHVGRAKALLRHLHNAGWAVHGTPTGGSDMCWLPTLTAALAMSMPLVEGLVRTLAGADARGLPADLRHLVADARELLSGTGAQMYVPHPAATVYATDRRGRSFLASRRVGRDRDTRWHRRRRAELARGEANGSADEDGV